VRGGDKVVFTDGTTQNCEWGPGYYQNAGPARLPSIHPTILNYCKKLGVELQVEVNMSRSALLQNDAANGGKPVVMRQAVNDTRGHVSELLMKSVDQGFLDSDLSKVDKIACCRFCASMALWMRRANTAGATVQAIRRCQARAMR
jgi:monoamine oxidase